MINREITSLLINKLNDNKIILLMGPRQVGKSTLVNLLSKDFQDPLTWWNGDDADIRIMLKDSNYGYLKTLLGNTKPAT